MQKYQQYFSVTIPALDPWGVPYHYKSAGDHNPDYDLYSYGPDKMQGGTNENADIGNW